MTAESKHGKGLYRNTLSYFGGLIMVGAAGMILFLLLLEFSLKNPSPYLGIFTYMVFPMVFGAAVVLALYGMRRESLRRRRLGTKEAQPFPKLDLNDRKTRKWFAYILVGGSLLGILLTFVGYNAFLFTESVTFCGEVCHTVMEPEHRAYLASPHARVSCVECHVGHGADWYVKAKLSGLRQVLAVTFGTYETPIPVPIKNLRPARETCEECHWPEKFYGAQLIQNPHFRYNEANTAEQVSLLVKTGGGSRRLGENAGIHWHMILDNKVTFKASDKGLQKIPWVRVRDHEGKERIYRDKDSKISDDELDAFPEHVMDCMDCHNRPTHNFTPPDIAVDKAMAAGLISPTLPWIKKVAVDALTASYVDKEAAGRGINDHVTGFYKDRFPKILRDRSKEIIEAVASLEAIYDRSVFPAMKVDWKTYASNIGHRNWPGCFRCHDGKHVTESGGVLSRECTV
ncbi:MAG: cytochrome C, partial [Deltaproteobacteria bacterium]|nr:cytochrome C [Deltaproteobacteria bacterium]